MTKYLLTYHGGGMPETEAAQAQVMAAWTAWFERLDGSVVDQGNPTSKGRTVAPGGSVGPEGPAAVTGYTILEADSLDAAVELAKGCPVLAGGASIDVSETLDVM